MPRLVFDFPDPMAATGPGDVPGDVPADVPADGSPHSARRVVFRDPVEVVTARSVDEVRPAIARVAEAADGGLHAAGYLAYEAAPAFDLAMRVRSGSRLPLLWFGLFEGPAAGGVEAGEGVAGGVVPPVVPALDWRIETDRAAHATAVAAVRESIAEGRTYQVNLTTRMHAAFTGDPWTFYQRLRRAQGSGHHAFLDLGRHVILSVSPELFFHTRGRRVLTRPMKGTRPRGRWPEEDRALAEALRTSEKDRAESLMIADLLRNDLGRVCEPGSVRVPRLQHVERYRTVWQMTSTIEGRLRGDVRLPDLLGALFPCGSVTGAPKISTMAEIARLESSPREVYCGAIGWVRPGGDCTFNVPIRTAWLDREAGRIEYGTGGGVVWDSTAEGEYDELRTKALVVREPWPRFALLETLRLHDGRYTRLERHLRRMRESAAYFDFPDPEAPLPAGRDGAGPVRRALHDLAARHPAGCFLARVAFHPDGTSRASATPLEGPGGGAVRVALADMPVDPSDRFLFHKTSHRSIHETRRAAAPAGLFDVLLQNDRGELTEFTRGNLVLDLDSRLLTPPRTAGLLAGCLRQELLEDGTLAEATLRPGDLDRASRIWFINSARGWIEVLV